MLEKPFENMYDENRRLKREIAALKFRIKAAKKKATEEYNYSIENDCRKLKIEASAKIKAFEDLEG